MSHDESRYPIGPMPTPEKAPSLQQREEAIERIETLPARLRAAVEGFTEEQWRTPYRSGGWTVRQLVHHLADSHMHAYLRSKLALTENEPTISPYDEAAWAELPDCDTVPPGTSLDLLESLHRRWVALIRSLPDDEFRRAFHHPGHGRTFTLDQQLAQYAWHSDHHLEHVLRLRTREGW